MSLLSSRRSVSLARNLFIAVLPAIVCSTGVMAQTTDDQTLEEIVVTAERRETDLQKTAISIQVMSGETLNAEGKRRIDEMMDGVVGVSSQGSQVGTDFFMRGLGTQGGPPVAGVTQSAVAILIDGVYQNRGETVRGGTLDVKQVEVMRGTQSTTLGASSLAGAISLVSRDPVFETQGRVSLGIGNYALRTGEAVLNLPLSDDKAFRIAYSSENRDGYLSSGAGDSDQTNVRVKYRWQPSDSLDIVLTGQSQVIGGNGVDTGVLAYRGHWVRFDSTSYTEADCGGPGYYATCMWEGASDVPIFGLVNDGVKYDKRSDPWDDGYPKNAWPNDPYRHTTISTYSANVNWETGIGTLTVVPSYQEADFESREPPRGNSYRAEDRHQETTQLDMQLTSNADSPFEWLAGVYWYDTQFDGLFDSYCLGSLSGFPGPCGFARYEFTANKPNAQQTGSAYFNSTFNITDELRLNLGVRYTKDKKHITASNTVASDNIADKPASVSGFSYTHYRANWDDTTYRVGLEYDVGDDSMLYTVAATGYTAGRIAAFGPDAVVQPAETLDQYTLGYKSRFLEDRLQFNVELFHSQYHDRPMEGSVAAYTPNWTTGEPCQAPPGPPSAFVFDTDSAGTGECVLVPGANIPDLTSQGVDVEMTWLMSDAMRLDLTVEYLDSTQSAPDVSFLSAADLTAAGSADGDLLYSVLLGNLGQYDGLTLQNSPEYTANLSWSYDIALSGGSTLTPSINIAYSDSYWSLGGGPGADIANPGDSYQDAYSLFNFYLGWVSADGAITANAFVRNIANKPILSNYGTEAAGYVTLKPPRTIGVNVGYNF